MLLKNLLLRTWYRALEIPTRGFPRGVGHDSFDLEYGTETAGIHWWTNPRSENFACGVRYEPCSPELCRMAIERSRVDPKRFCFLDIGCGKGRPLIIGSEYGFKELIGIDYAARLCRIAERNLEICGINGFQIFNADATEFEYPNENILAFLHNPFKDDVMRIVLEKLKAATSEYELVIAYAGDGGQLLGNQDWLEQFDCVPSLRLLRKRSH